MNPNQDLQAVVDALWLNMKTRYVSGAIVRDILEHFVSASVRYAAETIETYEQTEREERMRIVAAVPLEEADG